MFGFSSSGVAGWLAGWLEVLVLGQTDTNTYQHMYTRATVWHTRIKTWHTASAGILYVNECAHLSASAINEVLPDLRCAPFRSAWFCFFVSFSVYACVPSSYYCCKWWSFCHKLSIHRSTIHLTTRNHARKRDFCLYHLNFKRSYWILKYSNWFYEI